MKYYMNGTLDHSFAYPSTRGITTGGSMFGLFSETGVSTSVYLDEVHISKGIARWTSDFTTQNTQY